MATNERPPTPLGSSLARVVGGLGDRGGLLDLHGRWVDVVGAAVAEHSAPRRVEHGRLLIEVDHPGWATELRFLEREIVTGLGKLLPELEVTSISVTVGRARNSD